MEKSDANAKKMRALFHQAVGGGEDYRLIFGYTEDVSRFNYRFVHGSKTKIGNLLVGWNEDSQTIVSRSYSPGSFRLRRAGLLPPLRNFEGISK